MSYKDSLETLADKLEYCSVLLAHSDPKNFTASDFVVAANAIRGHGSHIRGHGSHIREQSGAKDLPPVVSMKQFSVVNRGRCEHPKGFNHPLELWDTSDWFLAILGELGEAANVAKKLNRIRDGIMAGRKPGDDDKEALQAKLRKELGDVLVYLDLTAQAHGFNILDAAIEVFNNKSKDIGYPVQI